MRKIVIAAIIAVIAIAAIIAVVMLVLPAIGSGKNNAVKIALSSDCIRQGGTLTGNGDSYDAATKTWLLGLDISHDKICNPACMVNEETQNAEINWRCTGLLPKLPNQ